MTFRLWRPLGCIGMLALSFTSPPAFAQTLSGLQNTAQRIGRAPRLPTTQPAIEGEAMPMDRIEKPVLLDDQLEAIRAGLPDFNSVIIRDSGVPNDFPMLPAMTLKNVSLGQFLQFVEASFPGVRCVRIDGPAGSIYSIRIQADESALRRAAAAQEQNRLRIYRLNDMISAQADDLMSRRVPTTQNDESKEAAYARNRAEAVKEATDQVLSLLQAALDQTDQDGQTTLKIHQPTLTLMFKGSKAKQAVLDEALNALQPNRVGRKFGGFSTVNPYAQPPMQMWNTLQDEPFARSQEALAEQQAKLAEQRGRMDEAMKLRGIAPASPVAPIAPIPAKSNKE